MSQVRKICVFMSRLERATRVELDRLCRHLDLEEGAGTEEIEKAYLDAADNSIFKAIRPALSSDAPTYLTALIIIYKELRPYSEALDETWRRVKRLELWSYQSPIEEMDELELEDKILLIYRAEYGDAKEKLASDPSRWKQVAKYIPGVGTAGVGAATTLVVHTAARAPFAAIGSGAVAGPVGIALGVITVGAQLSGPNYRKIIPATVEIMLIGKRIENMPKE